MAKKIIHYTLFFLIGAQLFACKVYKQHYMFKIDEEKDLEFLSKDVVLAEKNYLIQPNDILEVRIFTNKGERLIDPNRELNFGETNRNLEKEKPEFLVREDGCINLPMVGNIHISGMKLYEAEEYLTEKYATYYQEPFVIIKYLNKRVVILGAPGGQVIPLINEDVTLLEIIAQAGGIDQAGKAHNIRLIRGDLHQPDVFMIDLSTLEGMRKSHLSVKPGDVIYIEPTRKVFTESAQDIMLLMSFVVNTVSLIVLINKL